MATHSYILAWRIPWTEEPGGLESMSLDIPHIPKTHAHVFSHVQLSCNPMDCSLTGSSVHEILESRILEWVAISSSRGST